MNSKNYWNRASKFYDKAMTKEPQNYEKIGRFLEEVCHKEMNALEIACGTGLISQNWVLWCAILTLLIMHLK